MRTEAKKSFTHGFLLTEAEVRRLANEIQDQLAKTGAHPIVSSFELKLRNGTIAHPPSLDDVLREDNIGPALITSFRMSFFPNDASQSSRFVSIEFRNPWREPGKSISYTVSADDRDWALVVTSRIEDRIATSRRRFDFGPIMLAVVAAMVLGVLFWTFLS